MVERSQILRFSEKHRSVHAVRTHVGSWKVSVQSLIELIRLSVKVRLQSPEGIDAASFLYQSLQAYDFLRLFETKQCQLQVTFRLLYWCPRLGAPISGVTSQQESTCVKKLARPRLIQKVNIPVPGANVCWLNSSWSVWVDSPTASLSVWWKAWQVRWKCVVLGSKLYASLRLVPGMSSQAICLSAHSTFCGRLMTTQNNI